MTIEVISLGNSEMLEVVLNGLAMLTTSTGEYNVYGLARLGFMIGLIGVGVAAVVSQRLEPQKLLFGFVMFYVMFSPKETVSITDQYTSDVRTVANVPIGVAIPMYAISQTGKWITDAFETIYAIPESKLEHGFMSSLKTLVNASNISSGKEFALVERSLKSYMDQCVLYELQDDYLPDTEKTTVSAILSAPNILDAIETGYVNRDVLTHIASSGLVATPTQASCKDGYANMVSYLRSDFLADWDVSSVNRDIVSERGSTRRAKDEIERAAAALRVSIDDGHEYMMSAMLNNVAKCSFLSECAMLTQAAEQRNAKWGGDSVLFKQVARPMMAFIEILVATVTPLMAFLFGIGPMGTSIGMKYFLMLIWIVLWQPLLAVVNLYIHIVASADLRQLSASTIDLNSPAGIDSAWTTLADWLATGNMMASSVPALALMLVYGGSVAATSLNARMSSGNQVDPSVVAPNIASTAAAVSGGGLLSSGARQMYNPTGGTHMGGSSEAWTASADSSSARTQASSLAEGVERQSSAVRQQQLALGSSLAKEIGSQFSSRTGTAEAARFASSSSKTDQLAAEQGKAFKWSDTQAMEWASALKATAAMGISPEAKAAVLSQFAKDRGLNFSPKADVGGQLGAAGRASYSQDEAITDGLKASSAEQKQRSSETSNSTTSETSNVASRALRASGTASASQTLSSSQSKLDRLSQQYSEAVSLSNALGTGVSISASQFHGIASKDPGVAAATRSLAGALLTPAQLESSHSALMNSGHYFSGDSRSGPDLTSVQAHALVTNGHGEKLLRELAKGGYLHAAPKGDMNPDSHKGIVKGTPGLDDSTAAAVTNAAVVNGLAGAAAGQRAAGAAAPLGGSLGTAAPVVPSLPPPGGPADPQLSQPAGSATPVTGGAPAAAAGGGHSPASRGPAPVRYSPATPAPAASAPSPASNASSGDPVITNAAVRAAAARNDARLGLTGSPSVSPESRSTVLGHTPDQAVKAAGEALKEKASPAQAMGMISKALDNTLNGVTGEQLRGMAMELGGAAAGGYMAAKAPSAIARKVASSPAMQQRLAKLSSKLVAFAGTSAGRQALMQFGLKTAGRGALALTGPVGWAVGAASGAIAAKEVYDLYQAIQAMPDPGQPPAAAKAAAGAK